MFDPEYPPRLYDGGGDLSKRWYIDFRIWDTDRGAFVRKQYTGLNRHKTLAGRRSAAKKKLAEITELIEAGYTAGKSAADSTGLDWRKVTVAAAVEYVRDQKRLRRGVEEYKRLVRRLNEFPAFGALPVRAARPIHVAGFMEFINKRKKRDGQPIGAKSYNHYRNTLSTVFNKLLQLEIVLRNPCIGIDCLPVAPSALHLPYSDEQRAAVRAELLRRDDHQLLLFISFIYYCFIRSGGELRLLRVRDLHARTVAVPAANAKNDQTEHVAIPPKLEAMIQEYGLRECPPDYYIFTHSGTPGPVPVGPNYFPLRHRRVLRMAGILNPAHTIYGYKHTGAINLYLATNDIELVRRHCRHSHAGITATYLRGLGAMHDGDRLDAMPDF